MQTRSPRALVVAVLAIELLCADAVRWPLTRAPVGDAVEHELAHTVVTSANWQREGALARHFVPSRSIDQSLPEFWTNHEYYRNYLSVPLFGFMLHYAATRVMPWVEPVLLGKLLAHALIAGAVLASAALLVPVFSFWPTLAALSMLIWSKSFSVWLIDGYFGTTPALAFQLVLVAWSIAWVDARRRGLASGQHGWRAAAVAGMLSFCAGFSEWIAVLATPITIPAFLVAAVVAERRGVWRSDALKIAAAMVAGTGLAVLTTIVLFVSKLGWRVYWGGLNERIYIRSGDASLRESAAVILKQMHTGWPHDLLVGLLAAFSIVVIWLIAAIGRRRHGDGSEWTIGLALLLGVAPSLVYHLKLRNMVSVHWWFTGTWTIAWAITVAAVLWLVNRLLERWPGGRAGRVASVAVSVAACGYVIAANVRFVDAIGMARARAVWSPQSMFRALGGDLPRDGIPLVVVGMPGRFNSYPFATAYLRRSIVEQNEKGEVHPVGTTDWDAGGILLERWPRVYVAYDPLDRDCAGEPVALGGWAVRDSMRVCLASTRGVVVTPADVFGRPSAGDAAILSARIQRAVSGLDCCDVDSLVAVTTAVYRRLSAADGATIDALRRDHRPLLETIVNRWKQVATGRRQTSDPRFPGATLLGLLASRGGWYALLDNMNGDPLPDLHDGMHVVLSDIRAELVTPYAVRSRDGTALLPFTVLQLVADAGLPVDHIRLELFDFSAHLLRTEAVRIHPGPAKSGS
jgi:hypothetical protein